MRCCASRFFWRGEASDFSKRREAMRQYLIEVREKRRQVALISTHDEQFKVEFEKWAKAHDYTVDVRTGEDDAIRFQHK